MKRTVISKVRLSVRNHVGKYFGDRDASILGVIFEEGF